MSTSKLYLLLNTLREEEVANFHRYLKYAHAKRRGALSLFEYIRKTYKKPKTAQLDIERAYRKTYDVALGDQRKAMLNTLSDLYLWLKEFLLWEKSKSDCFESQLLWLSLLKEKGLEAEFSKRLHTFHEESKPKPPVETKDYLTQLIGHHLLYFDASRDKGMVNIDYIKAYAEELNRYQAIGALKAACEILTIRNLRPADFDPAMAPEQLFFQALPAPKGDPLITIYLSIYRLIDTQEEAAFRNCMNQLPNLAGKITPEELNTIRLYLNNYASSQVRLGKEAIWKDINTLNRIGTEYGVFIKSGEMSIAQFHNIVNAACKAQNFEWVKTFVTTQINYLEAGIREDAELLAEGMVAFEKNNFKLMVKTLKKVSQQDMHVKMRTKSLLIIGYYETSDPETDLFTFCVNFELLLKRNRKSMVDAVQGILNFVNFVKLLLQGRLPKEELIAQMKATRLLYFRPWLEKKSLEYKPIK